MGVVALFNLTFELAWKAMQAILPLYGVDGAKLLTPRDVLKTAYSSGFIKDDANWLLMLKSRNISVHVYEEELADKLLELIKDNFIMEFQKLKATLELKLQDLKV